MTLCLSSCIGPSKAALRTGLIAVMTTSCLHQFPGIPAIWVCFFIWSFQTRLAQSESGTGMLHHSDCQTSAAAFIEARSSSHFPPLPELLCCTKEHCSVESYWECQLKATLCTFLSFMSCWYGMDAEEKTDQLQSAPLASGCGRCLLWSMSIASSSPSMLVADRR